MRAKELVAALLYNTHRCSRTVEGYGGSGTRWSQSNELPPNVFVHLDMCSVHALGMCSVHALGVCSVCACLRLKSDIVG